ncbi:MAG TPA: amidohydrolase family protein [Gemmatimonadaceae bacterium]|nr:amidohydrolase family protein [Gemmatimonadaceae bacterium]
MRFFVFSITLGTALSAAVQAQVLITASRAFNGRGELIQNAAIVVDAGKITHVGAAPANFRGRRYDLGDVTLLPGLIDVHSHIVWYLNSKERLHTSDDGDSPAVQALAWAGNAITTLRAGVTTVQSPGSPEDAELREAIARGRILGPRLITSLGSLNERSSADELRARIRELKARGADVIKLFASKSIRDGGGATMTQEQLNAACDEGHKQGLRVLVHAHAADAVRAAVLAGCDQIEHGVFTTDDVLKLMAERGTYFSPQCGLVFRNYLGNKRYFEGIGNYNAEGFAAMERAIPLAVDVVRRAARTARLKLVWGTDAVAGSHGNNVDDLICRVNEAGQPAADALISATSRAAESLGRSSEIGALAPGLQADIIAVQGNPLQDITMLKRVVFVMKGGGVVRHDGAMP